MRKLILILFLITSTVFCEVIHVNPIGQEPINKAMLTARSGDTIVLADGKYYEEVVLKGGVVLYSPNLFGAQIIGNGRNPVIKLGNSSKICGLAVSGGRNGVISSNPGATIENCWIHSNQGSGILAMNRLPRITNSIISNNLNSGIQATQIGSVEGELQHLTIADNRQNGIEIDGDQKIYLKDCIFYRNSNKSIKASNFDLILFSNTIFFPEQKEFSNETDFIAVKPQFVNKLFLLKDNSIGKNRASDGRDIGFVK